MSKYKFIERLKKQKADCYENGLIVRDCFAYKDIMFSVQASNYHNCEPRRTSDLEEYKSFEISIWFKQYPSIIFKENTSIMKIFEDYKSTSGFTSDGSMYITASFVPNELVEEIFLYLETYNKRI